jgi:hypothetical protein
MRRRAALVKRPRDAPVPLLADRAPAGGQAAAARRPHFGVTRAPRRHCRFGRSSPPLPQPQRGPDPAPKAARLRCPALAVPPARRAPRAGATDCSRHA